MATLFVDKIDPQSGTSLEIGSSGDTITTATGAKPSFLYPAFEATLSGNQEMSDNTTTKIQFDTERFDTDNCYDNSTNYRFTPIVAGKYFVYCTARLDSRTNSNLNLLQLNIYKNGTIYTELQNYFVANYIRQISATRNSIIDMNGSTDYLEMFAHIDVISTGSGNPRVIGGSGKEAAFGAYRIGS